MRREPSWFVDTNIVLHVLRESPLGSHLVSHRLGKSMGKNDLWIAASSIETDSVLLTTDRDFDHLSPAHLRLWWLDPAAASWPTTPP